MRINKYLAECGVCSRRKADELVKSGRVSVNKKTVTEAGFDVDEQKDVVYVDSKKVVRATHYTYLMFNKPKRCVTTLDDESDNKSGRPSKASEQGKNKASEQSKQPSKDTKRRTIYDYIPEEYRQRRLFPVGRLDYDSEGLLLLTNDGDLTFRLTHPSHEIPKTYAVKIEGEIQESDLAILRKGVKFEGVQYAKCKVKVTAVEKEATRLEVVLTEGKNREVRRMFEAVEKNVIFLKRIAIGELRLGGLSRGGCRELNENEVAYLKALAESARPKE